MSWRAVDNNRVGREGVCCARSLGTSPSVSPLPTLHHRRRRRRRHHCQPFTTVAAAAAAEMGACGCKPAAEVEEQQPSTSTSDTQVLLKPPTQTSRFRRTGTARVHPSLEISPVAVASFTHEGGAGSLGKENQDTRFTAQLGAVMVCGVFDGHGKRHGQLAARVAAEATENFLRTHVAALVEDPEQTLRRAFAWSHAAIRKAMLASDPSLRVVGGEDAAEEVREAAYLLEWLEAEEEDEEAEWDAADGGTTATVAVLLHGRTLVVAAVGDSSALLLARDSAGQPVHAALCPDHGPTNVAEYDRMQSHPSQPCRFVYDCPDEAEEIAIFHQAEDGGTVLDSAALARADAADVALKNARGERCTVVWIPETSLELPHRPDLSDAQGAAQRVTLEEQATTVTRSLGDFCAQRASRTPLERPQHRVA